MISKAEKAGRKAVRDDLKRREWRDAETKLPASKSDLKGLFDWLDAKLGEEGCEHTLKHSISFLKRRGLPQDEVVAWLKEEGGYCDCEVIGNVEDKWGEIIGGEI